MMPVNCNTEKLLNNICRLCLKQDNSMSSIFEAIDNESNEILAEKITSIASVEISPMDGLPISICHMCRRQVDQFHEFRLLIEISDKALRACLLKTTQEIKSPLENNPLFDNNNEYKDFLQNQTDEFNSSNKDIIMMNYNYYTLLVPTSDGLQVWKVSDVVEPNEDFNNKNYNNDNNIKTIINRSSKNTKIFTDSIQLQEACNNNNNKIIKKIDEDEQLPLRKNETMNCQLCFNEFKSLKDLKNHITEHCLSCENIVTDQDNNTLDNQQIVINNNLLVGVVNEHFSADRNNQHLSKSNETTKESSPRAKLFQCRYCNKLLFNRITLKKHQEKCQLKEMKLICHECGKQFNKISELRYHKGTHLASPLMCSTCNKYFRNIQSFKMHIKRHTLGSRFNCKTCGQSYYTNSELARHVQKHEEKRKYPCHLCEMSFLSKPELNRHMKYHNGVKQFECNLCCKSYYESGHLKIHQRIHTGERPFVCEICTKAFVTRSKLVRHLKIHTKKDT